MARKRRAPGRRKVAGRWEGDTVLIVCEGTDTEPNYLETLKEHYKLNSAAVEVVPASHSAPKNVVEYAIKKAIEACQKGNPYAKVYCVIDKDRHSTYQSALESIRNFKMSDYVDDERCETILCAIVSVPCFEYWILMHFTASTASYGAGSRSPCDDLIHTAMRRHLPGYSKVDSKLAYKFIEESLSVAIKNSQTTLRAAKRDGTDDPLTYMHLLVEELEYLKENKRFNDDKKGCPDV